MPTLLPLVTTKCTTMCDPVHDLTYKIHRATVPLFDKLSRKEFSLKLQFSLLISGSKEADQPAIKPIMRL